METLVVHANPNLCNLIAKYLKSNDFNSICVVNRNNIDLIIGGKRFEIIIVDLRVMEDKEFVEKIRRLDNKVKIIAISSSPLSRKRINSLYQNGVSSVLWLPVQSLMY